MNHNLLMRLDAILDEAITAVEGMDPDHDETVELHRPLVSLGHAVDQVKTMRSGEHGRWHFEEIRKRGEG